MEPKRKVGLIDDSEGLCHSWELSLFDDDIELVTFPSIRAFIEADEAESMDRNMELYVDFAIPGEAGDVDSEKLYNLGFHTIYLCTGYPPDHFESKPWIKKVVGKMPPWLEKR